MKYFKSIVFVLSILMMTSLNAQKNYKKTLLTIGDEEITAGEFMKVFTKNNFNNETVTQQSLKEYLELYINFKLKVKEAEALKMDTIPKLISELDGYRKQLAEPYFNDSEVTEELLKEAYERKLLDVRTSHILIKCSDSASPADTLEAYNKVLDLKKRIENGEDFAKLAVEFSDDPSVRDQKEVKGVSPFRPGNKGDLGYFTVFDMLYPFEQGAYTTEVNSLAEPIRTRYGYHLIKITKKAEAIGKAQVAHIFLRLDNTASEEDALRVEEKINNIYKELEEGANYEDLVLKHSEDQGSFNRKGVLPAFGANRMVPQFYDAAMSIPEVGMYAKPVQTSFGWHILKLIDRQKVGSFEDEKSNLEEKLSRDMRSQKSRKTVIKNIKQKHNLIEFDVAKSEVYQTLDSTYLANKWTIDKAEGLNSTILKIGDKEIGQQEFADFIVKNQKGNHPLGIDVYFENVYNTFVDKCCVEFLDENLENFYPEFKSLMQEYRDGVLLFELTDEKVWSAAVKDTSGLLNFYEENKQNYMWGERLNATIITVLDPEKVFEIREFSEKFPEKEKIEAEFNKPGKQLVKVKTANFSKGDDRVIDQINWTVGTTNNISSSVETAVKFVIVHELLEPSVKELKEARGLVTADYQTYLEKSWLEELKAKYTYDVNYKILKKLK